MVLYRRFPDYGDFCHAADQGQTAPTHIKTGVRFCQVSDVLAYVAALCRGTVVSCIQAGFFVPADTCSH